MTDIITRALGQALSQSWGQPFVVDNRPGGDETLGIEATAKSPPDGYTLVVSSNGGITAAPHRPAQSHPVHIPERIHPCLHAGAGNAGDGRAGLVIDPVGARPHCVAKAKPGELNYGSFGNGSYSHVAMEDFKQRRVHRCCIFRTEGRPRRTPRCCEMRQP